MAAKDESRPSYPMLGKLPIRSASPRTGTYRGEPSEGISDRAIQRRMAERARSKKGRQSARR